MHTQMQPERGAITVIEPYGTVTTIHAIPTLTEMQALVRGYIEVVHRIKFDDILMVVNEEGILQGLGLNPIATQIAGQPIFGTAFLICNEDLL